MTMTIRLLVYCCVRAGKMCPAAKAESSESFIHVQYRADKGEEEGGGGHYHTGNAIKENKAGIWLHKHLRES
jgi:hypothetical protein